MGNSYTSSNVQSSVNIENISNILTQNQNVVSTTVITSQTQYITVNGNISCTQFNAIQYASITVTITGQMNAQTSSDIANYINTSIQASIAQSAKVVTELLGVYGGNEQLSSVSEGVNQFCQTNITTQNLQVVMANVRATQVQGITINGNISGALCNFENNITVAVAAQGILTAIATQMEQNTLTSNLAAAVSQYYSADAKGLNSLVSAALTALLLPLIIGAVVIGLLIIIVVIFKLLSSKSHNQAITQAKTLSLDPNNPSADRSSVQNLIQTTKANITKNANNAASSPIDNTMSSLIDNTTSSSSPTDTNIDELAY